MLRTQLRSVLLVTLTLTMVFHTDVLAAPWKPQGRFGKRADLPLAELAKLLPLSGEIEFPVEAFGPHERVETLRVAAKLCTITGVEGFAPCSS